MHGDSIAIPAPPSTPPAIGIDAAGVAQLLGISESHFFALLKTGRFGPEARRLGRAKRYSRSEVLAWFEAGCPSRARWQAAKGSLPNRASGRAAPQRQSEGGHD
jgi:predicted DNA-binding transcriptional regulator AlpA